ncbi:hypothetical protein AAG612_11235 [Citromicrobium bathyomarinum]|uniref:hypothetical protein n=1 Tax=Citromicrobium bathyomarinum TaxID=72174 RepID=UPI00315AD6F7
MIRVRVPAFDRLALALERRALRRLDARVRAARLDGHGWRSPAKLWPNFGDD